MQKIKREYVFLTLVCFIGVILLYKMTLSKLTVLSGYKQKIEVSVRPQLTRITNLYQERNTTNKETRKKIYFVDTLDFPEDQFLYHKKLGKLPYKKDFFIDFSTEIKVKRAGIYEFEIYCNDGFDFVLDEESIYHHLHRRKYQKTKFEVELDAKTYPLTIQYYEGRKSKQGIKVQYRYKGHNDVYVLGDSSSYLSFKKIKRQKKAKTNQINMTNVTNVSNEVISTPLISSSSNNQSAKQSE